MRKMIARLLGFWLLGLPVLGLAADADLPGKKLQEMPRLNAEILRHHVPLQVQEMRKAGKEIAPEVDTVLKAASQALEAGDSYRAYRLFARAYGLAHSPRQVLAYDVAGAFAVKLNRAIFWPADTIEVTLGPLYDVGALPGEFRARIWLETAQGVVPETERTFGIRDIGPRRVSYSAAKVPAGTVSAGYELLSPEGESLVRVYYTFAVAPAGRPTLPELRALVASIRPKTAAPSLATDTLDYVVDGLARDTAGYDGHWRREMLPFAVRFGSGVARPGFWGPVRCPEDLDFALELIRDLQAGRDPLSRRRGDMRLALRLGDGELMSFRIFVPDGDPRKLRGTLVAFHSGAGDQSYFEWESFFLPAGQPYENTFKKLAQQYGFLAVCPAGHFDSAEPGAAMVKLLIERVRAVYEVPAEATFLTGWSGGASAAWRIALSHPDRFAGLAAVAGEASWLTQQLATGAAKLPVLFVTGDRDFAIQQAHATRDLAQQYLPLFQYKELPDTEHQQTWPRAQELVFRFLDQTRRAGEIHRAAADGSKNPPGLGGVPAEIRINANSRYAGSELRRRVDEAVRPLMAGYESLNVALVRNSRIEFARAYGAAGLNTEGQYASVSKPVTATIVRMFLAQGKIASLDDDVWKYSSRYQGCMPERYKNSHLTIRHLLAHRSGMTNSQGTTWKDGKLNLLFEPGTGFSYSTGGYGVLGHVLEDIAKEPFERILGRYIAEPIHAGSFKAWPLFSAPGAGVSSTIEDMARFAIGIMDDTYGKMPGADCLGWQCGGSVSDPVLSHPGVNGKPVAYMMLRPRQRIGVMAFAVGKAGGGAGLSGLATLSQGLLEMLERAPGGTFECDYLGQTPPGDEPEVFAKGTVSADGKNTHALQFSPDGQSLIFSRYPDGTSFRMVRSPDGWSQPRETSFRGKEVSFDGASNRLFYYDQGDLFFVRYGPDGFSVPTRLPAPIDTPETEYFPSVTAKGNLYFSRNGRWDLARLQVARIEGDGFGAPVDLGEPVNAGGASHAFVAPDESYILFNSPRQGSRTKNDIWASFRRPGGAWTTPVNLGDRINRESMAVLCPTVSPDGKYLFFTRLQANGTGYLYWVSARILDDLKRQALGQ